MSKKPPTWVFIIISNGTPSPIGWPHARDDFWLCVQLYDSPPIDCELYMPMTNPWHDIFYVSVSVLLWLGWIKKWKKKTTCNVISSRYVWCTVVPCIVEPRVILWLNKSINRYVIPSHKTVGCNDLSMLASYTTKPYADLMGYMRHGAA